MPYKHNENFRYKFEKTKYRATNWPEYNQALKRLMILRFILPKQQLSNGIHQRCISLVESCFTQHLQLKLLVQVAQPIKTFSVTKQRFDELLSMMPIRRCKSPLNIIKMSLVRWSGLGQFHYIVTQADHQLLTIRNAVI
jgi:hypothetical protein